MSLCLVNYGVGVVFDACHHGCYVPVNWWPGRWRAGLVAGGQRLPGLAILVVFQGRVAGGCGEPGVGWAQASPLVAGFPGPATTDRVESLLALGDVRVFGADGDHVRVGALPGARVPADDPPPSVGDVLPEASQVLQHPFAGNGCRVRRGGDARRGGAPGRTDPGRPARRRNPSTRAWARSCPTGCSSTNQPVGERLLWFHGRIHQGVHAPLSAHGHALPVFDGFLVFLRFARPAPAPTGARLYRAAPSRDAGAPACHPPPCTGSSDRLVPTVSPFSRRSLASLAPRNGGRGVSRSACLTLAALIFSRA